MLIKKVAISTALEEEIPQEVSKFTSRWRVRSLPHCPVARDRWIVLRRLRQRQVSELDMQSGGQSLRLANGRPLLARKPSAQGSGIYRKLFGEDFKWYARPVDGPVQDLRIDWRIGSRDPPSLVTRRRHYRTMTIEFIEILP